MGVKSTARSSQSTLWSLTASSFQYVREEPGMQPASIPADNILDNTYYLYGNSYGRAAMGQSDIKLYSSNDLIQWRAGANPISITWTDSA
jgi:hypothetical protein